MKHILSSTDLTGEEIEQLFTRAGEFARNPQPILRGKTVALVSTGHRSTSYRYSLKAAGADVSPRENLVESYGLDAAIIGQSAQATSRLVPHISASQAADENPLEALIHLYAIRQAKGTLDGLYIALLGNLKTDAAAHSLAAWLGNYETRLSFISPAALSMPYDLSDNLRAAGLELEETNDLDTTLQKADVLYLSRLDPARIEKKVYDRTRANYRLSPERIASAKPGLYILGDWDGADELLRLSHATVEQASQAILPTLVEYAIIG